MIDYHIHTRLCNHAQETMDAYVKKAVHMGLREICFLDHLIISGEGRRSSMHPGEVGLYFQAVQNLKYQYQDRIQIRAGLELDFHSREMEAVRRIIEPYAWDVIGGSVHFIDNRNIVSRREQADLNDDAFQSRCLQYLDELNRMLDDDCFDVICHLDVIKKFSPRLPETVMEKFDEIIAKIRYKGLTVEVNTSGQNHPAHEIYPGPDLLQTCLRRGVPITLASDAHHPDMVGQYHDQVLAGLVSMGFTHLAGFRRRKRYRIPIELNGGQC